MYPVSYGAVTQLYAGTSPEAIRLGGQVLFFWFVIRRNLTILTST